MYRLALARDVSALPALCLLMRKETFDRVGGFDSRQYPGALYDIDLCLKLSSHGYRLISTPLAQIVMRLELESADPHKVELVRKEWPESFKRDPFWNPHLLASGELCGGLGDSSLID
jgi:GT2 family glycosyltransferase